MVSSRLTLHRNGKFIWLKFTHGRIISSLYTSVEKKKKYPEGLNATTNH